MTAPGGVETGLTTHIPPSGEDCQFCQYKEAVGSVEH